MKTYTVAQALAALVEDLSYGADFSETDNQGQIVIYTNLFKWDDGTIRDEPQPE